MPMQQTAQSTLPTASMSVSGSSHGSGPGYSHSGPASQSVPLQGQGAISNYVSRANINMQSNPGNARSPSTLGACPWGPPHGSRGLPLLEASTRARVGGCRLGGVQLWGSWADPALAAGKALRRSHVPCWEERAGLCRGRGGGWSPRCGKDEGPAQALDILRPSGTQEVGTAAA